MLWLSWLHEVHGTCGLAPLPSQILTLGGHGSAEKDVEDDIAEDVVGHDEGFAEDVAEEDVAEDIVGYDEEGIAEDVVVERVEMGVEDDGGNGVRT
jgi:hypothetical protein